MATGNFYNKNASKIFALILETEFDYDDSIENLQCELSNMGFDSCNEWDNERNYGGQTIATKIEYKTYCGVEFGVEIKAIIRSGYYEHANLDWEVEFISNCDNLDEIPNRTEIADTIEWYEGNPGMAKIQAPNVENWLENTKDTFIEELENKFEEFSTPLSVSARFSNGETWYEKV